MNFNEHLHNLQGLKDLGNSYKDLILQPFSIKFKSLNYLLFILIIVFFGTSTFAQTIKIEISDALPKAILYELEGEETTKVDSAFSKNDIFQFNLSDKHIGFYRLQFDNRHVIDFINDGKEIELKTNYKGMIDSLVIVNSESNRLYYKFLKLNKSYKTKTDLLQLILTRYPQDDDYYTLTQKKLTETQKAYLEFVNHTSQKTLNSFIARYIKYAQLPVIYGTLSAKEQLDYLKKHSLDNVDFNDSEMIYSDLFTSKSIEYLTYYRNPQLPKALLEKEFMKAVDTLLTKARVNELVYQHITEYLIDGFTKFGFDNLIDYIITNYVMADDLCLNEETGSSVQRRVNQAKYLKIGEPVPNVILPDTSGKSVDLSEITAEKTLLLFYASWCPHCQSIIPKIRSISKDKKGLEVLAISLDTNRFEWINFIKDNNLNWLNISDLKGWDSEVAGSYYIYATPTMFLLDKDKKIIAKPLTFQELELVLEKASN